MTDGTAHVEGVVSAAEQAGGLLAGAVREEGLADLCGDEQRYSLSCNHAVPKSEKPIVCKDGLEDKSALTPYACKCFPRFSFWIWNA